MKIINFNKYIPKEINDFIIHKNIINLLQKTISNEMQHCLIYGPEQSGKKTLLYAFLRKLYNLESTFLFDEEEIETNIFMLKHKYFIKITIENKVNINEKIKEIIRNISEVYYNHKIIYTDSNILFKLLIIENIHYLNACTINYICSKMEKNIEFRRFIILSNTFYKLNRLSSYCTKIIVPMPNKNSIKQYLDNIILKENISITEHKYNYILSNCKSNLITVNVLLQHYLIEKKFKIVPSMIDNTIDSLIKIAKSNSIPKHTEIFTLIIKLLDFGLEQNKIMHLLSRNILKNEADFNKCCTIIKYTAEYDTKIKKIGENKLGLASYIIKLSSIYS